jgi:hypothetical protein
MTQQVVIKHTSPYVNIYLEMRSSSLCTGIKNSSWTVQWLYFSTLLVKPLQKSGICYQENFYIVPLTHMYCKSFKVIFQFPTKSSPRHERAGGGWGGLVSNHSRKRRNGKNDQQRTATHWEAKSTMPQWFFCFFFLFYSILGTFLVGFSSMQLVASCWTFLPVWSTFSMTPSIRNEKSASSPFDLRRKSEKRNYNLRPNVNCSTTSKTFWTIVTLSL